MSYFCDYALDYVDDIDCYFCQRYYGYDCPCLIDLLELINKSNQTIKYHELQFYDYRFNDKY